MKKSLNLLNHNLDIAVDLSGHTLHNKSYLFEHNISRIKLNYLGFQVLWGRTYGYFSRQNINLRSKLH